LNQISQNFLLFSASYLFTAAWNLLKGVFTGNTMSKITIFDSNRPMYIEELKKVIPEESMPKDLKK